ncbi:MAG: RNA polymerase sigma factor [Microthrixaceae bacterium]
MAQWNVVRGDDPCDDAALLRAVTEQDRSALHELYLRHEPWLTARLSHRCSDRQIVEEAVQDTFVTVWRTAGRYSGDGQVAAWIWGIGIRTLLHKVRPRKPLLDRLRAQRHATPVSAEDELLVRVEHGDLGVALERLSPELRQVVQATVLDGLSCREAGALLGVPTGTVKTRMMRARRELREALT